MNLRDIEVNNVYLKILRLLKENVIVGESEHELLARISKETGIELEQVGKRITEMLHEELIRRRTDIMSFDITNSGEEYLRDPKGGQRRIEEKRRLMFEFMRKEKRLALERVRKGAKPLAGAFAMQDFVSVEKKWENVGIPTKEKIDDIRKTASYLRTKIPELNDSQPKCWLLKENYDHEFLLYKAQVEEAREHNMSALRLLKDFSSLEESARDVQDDIESLKEWQEKNRQWMDDEQSSHALNIFIRLDVLKRCFESISKEELEELERLRKEFEKNESVLDEIRKPTHEWEPIELQTVVAKPGWIARAESSLESRVAEERIFVAKRKCKKCLKEE